MSRKRYSLLAALVLSVIFSGCFAWNYVEEGYDNFSAYFNTFYNANVAFNDALKDVQAEKTTYNLSLISDSHPPAFTISARAKSEFDDAIAKASKVLQFHPKSAFTEDCLFIIGISYYYEGDDIRGARKFLEIESTFPNTKRLAEAEMYYGGFQLSGQQNEVGRNRLMRAIQIAKESRNRKIVAQSAEMLADYYLREQDTLRAAAYLDTASTFSGDDDAAIYACRAGNLFTGIREYNKAIEEYKRAGDQARDIKIRFYALYYLARVDRLIRKYYLALGSLKELRNDDKYFDFFPLVDYQEAAVLYDSGEVSTAVTAFQKIDTSYASSDASTRSAFRLANIYLRIVGDFQSALKYYQKVVSHPKVYYISDQGQEMSKNLQDYFVAGYKVLLADSLYQKADSVVERHDTLTTYSRDMLDTLYERAADARETLAGMYMFRLQMPDSAVRSYNIILNEFPRSKVYASALYTLGEYYYSSGDTASGEKYLKELVTNHPGSNYAVSAASVLGIQLAQYVDSSRTEYSDAVALVNKGDYRAALDTVGVLLRNPKSSLAPQALYLAGWIYEKKLEKPDSAYTFYKRLSAQFPSSNYSSAVTLALNGYEAAQRDSAAARNKKIDSLRTVLDKNDKDEKAKHEPAEIQGPERHVAPGEKIDSLKPGSTPIDTLKHPRVPLKEMDGPEGSIPPGEKIDSLKPGSIPIDTLKHPRGPLKEIDKRVK